MRGRAPRSTLLLLLLCGPLSAQGGGYRMRIDTRFQSVAFRGVQIDSILASDTTGIGYAVHCAAGEAYCTFFRAGPRRQAAPVVTTVDISAWGFGRERGVRGVSLHATARLGVDLGDADAWPGTDPALQLLAGYVEYAAERVSARAGRQLVFSRLGATGFDGAAVTVRDSRRGLDVGGYVGWGLARGVALPVTSPALNPLDDFQPRQRQLVAGLEAGWAGARTDIRAVYQREVDPRSDYFVSERVAVAAAVRPSPGWSVSGGADYDLAAGWWGSADLSLGYATRAVTASVGARRYRPHFDLWTIWGAFSPVPYRSFRGDVSVRATRQIQIHARGERYRFENADVATPLVRVEQDGWRGEVGITVLPVAGWTVDGGYTREFGPGAASVGMGGSVTYAPTRAYRVSVHGSTLDRPLEFRYNESVLRVFGIDADGDVAERVRLSLGASRYAEERRRPDPAAFDWSQWRLTARAVLLFGRGADLGNLPPAVRRMPGGRSAR